jgi:hypothetical protein
VAFPATTITIPVTFNTEEWPVIVEARANGSWTADDSEKCVECTLTVRRHADGRTLVGYGAAKNAKYLSSLTLMATPQMSWDAISIVTAHLWLSASRGNWSTLIANFKCQYYTATRTIRAANHASPSTNFTEEVPGMELRSQPNPFVREPSSTSPVRPINAPRSTAPGWAVRK